jgi:RNA polymerase sigma factor (TIGR02999 family)
MSRRAEASRFQTGPPDPRPEGLELDALFPAVYSALRQLAHRRLQAEDIGHTLSTTALVNETYLRLADQRRSEFANRPHFFALAARAMRRILVDYARRHRAQKRPNPAHRISLTLLESARDISQPSAGDGADHAEVMLAVDGAVERLLAIDERLARVVEYRFFVGLTETETAELLGITPRTVARDWVRARAWLLTQLRPGSSAPPT